MSVCGQSGQAEEDSGSEEVTAATTTERDLYKQKPASKVVRVLTVLAYLLSVSLAAILLSVYYVCVWKSPELPSANSTAPVAASRLSANAPTSANAAAGAAYHTDGGGDSAVNALVDPSPVSNNSSQTPSLGADASPDLVPNTTDTSQPFNATYPGDDLNGTTASVT